MALLSPSGSSQVAAVGLQCRRDNVQGSIFPQNLTDPAGLMNSPTLSARGATIPCIPKVHVVTTDALWPDVAGARVMAYNKYLVWTLCRMHGSNSLKTPAM